MENSKNIKKVYLALSFLIAIIFFLAISNGVYAQRGNETANETINQTEQNNSTLPYIDQEILRAFENSTWVRVLVRLVDNSNIIIEGTKEERKNLSSQRDLFLNLQLEEFLSNILENETKNIRKHIGEFTADMTKEGFNKIVNDSRINEILLSYTAPGYATENTSLTENETTIEKTEEPKTERNFVFLWFLGTIIIILLVIFYILMRRKQK
ncbi:MAG: hypothetical protein V1886_03370 [archaeon]